MEGGLAESVMRFIEAGLPLVGENLARRGKEKGKAAGLINSLLEIIPLLERGLIERNEEFAAIFRLVGRDLLREGFPVAAAALYREGRRLFPEDEELLLGLGDALTRLHLFPQAEEALQADVPKGGTGAASGNNVSSRRRYTALGALYQAWERFAEARACYQLALSEDSCWVPAHMGLFETMICEGKVDQARAYLCRQAESLGPDPLFVMAMSQLALIAGDFSKAQELAIGLGGCLLGDERFEHLLFQLDFFQKDMEALTKVPYPLKGETLETEAVRIWLMDLRGQARTDDPLRIPECLWGGEYDALNRAWNDSGREFR